MSNGRTNWTVAYRSVTELWGRRVDPADREPGEIEVLVRCGSCNRVIGNLWGRPRSDAGGSIRTYDNCGAYPAGPPDENGTPHWDRLLFVCENRRCNRDYVVRSAKIIVAGLDVLDRAARRDRVIVLPDDVAGELDQTAPTVAEWRFVGR